MQKPLYSLISPKFSHRKIFKVSGFYGKFCETKSLLAILALPIYTLSDYLSRIWSAYPYSFLVLSGRLIVLLLFLLLIIEEGAETTFRFKKTVETTVTLISFICAICTSRMESDVVNHRTSVEIESS